MSLDAVDIFLDILDALGLLQIGDHVGDGSFFHIPENCLNSV